MVIEFDVDRPNTYRLKEVVAALKNGAVIIYPTDTVYALGCDLYNNKAIEKLCHIKGIKSNKSQFSFICSDLSNVSEYSKQLDNSVFKLMKKTLPGPYTYIVEANSKVPKIIQAKKKTVGIRIPDHPVTRFLVEELGNPIITTSLKSDDITEYLTDPYEMEQRYGNQVDFIIDCGYGQLQGSTVIDCSNGSIEVVREGLGDISMI